jgi:hypothetical protein
LRLKIEKHHVLYIEEDKGRRTWREDELFPHADYFGKILEIENFSVRKKRAFGMVVFLRRVC